MLHIKKMVSIKTFKKVALALPDVTEQPHFEKTSFRIKNKIFATLSEAEKKAVLKLTQIDQSVFCSFDKTTIYPVTGGWGKQGWTVVELSKVKLGMLKDALSVAYNSVLKKYAGRKSNDYRLLI
jgi:predicted DNA-binding protein (MmcQ/YjbR family)